VTSSSSAFRAILAKDLRVELRTLRSVPAMILFAVTTFVLFHFAVGNDSRIGLGNYVAGVLLVTVLFAAILAINRMFVAEHEEGGFELVRLAPVDRTTLFAAKLTALFVYLLILEIIAVPVFALFFLDSNQSGGLPMVALVLVLMNLGFAVTGTLISVVATNSTARDLLAPLILLPLFVPLIIAGAKLAGPALEFGDLTSGERPGTWLAVLGLYDLVFALVGYAVFDFLLDD
jgi:heme exporter protein B